jgi:hypothetical protein
MGGSPGFRAGTPADDTGRPAARQSPGCGPDALATSCAVERGLHLVPYPLDFDLFPFNAPERRYARMVADAGAAVIVWD